MVPNGNLRSPGLRRLLNSIETDPDFGEVRQAALRDMRSAVALPPIGGPALSAQGEPPQQSLSAQRRQSASVDLRGDQPHRLVGCVRLEGRTRGEGALKLATPELPKIESDQRSRLDLSSLGEPELTFEANQRTTGRVPELL
jgi:hypothetical protein